ncbi:MAG: hypothetical protein R3C61_13090 [Bacteroidia bacterium]
MKTLLAFAAAVFLTVSSAFSQRWIDDSLLWVKAPLKNFAIAHFQTISSGKIEAVSQQLTVPLNKGIFNDTMLVFKNIYSKLQVQDVKYATKTPEGEMIFVHISAAVSRRLPYDYFRTSPKLKAWVEKRGLDTRRYIALKVESKGNQYKIVSR